MNAAALTDRGSIWDTTEERYDEIFDVNVKAPFFLMQDALQLMKKSKTSGTIVNILSMSGHGGQDFISAYCGSKGALATLTKNVAFSVMNYRIRVNGLNIGWMDTPGEDRIMKTYHDAEPGWLEQGRGRPPLRPPAEARRSGPRRGLPLERRIGHDDRLHHRLRPAGAGHRQRHPGAARRRLVDPGGRRKAAVSVARTLVLVAERSKSGAAHSFSGCSPSVMQSQYPEARDLRNKSSRPLQTQCGKHPECCRMRCRRSDSVARMRNLETLAGS